MIIGMAKPTTPLTIPASNAIARQRPSVCRGIREIRLSMTASYQSPQRRTAKNARARNDQMAAPSGIFVALHLQSGYPEPNNGKDMTHGA
ncbi:hypothetical protein ACOXXX_13625 [Thalassococcus sp. BH17M4-6]|uniref:hypothetical protein n=1 Tax=Thalassococcus sp. BH17M4-6 TaxID=3413148 RepID=UPI003BDFF55C